jgi:N4-gp56 family major capsid protein
MAFNTTINTSLLTTYLIRKFVPALEKELQLHRFTTKAMIPPGEGNVGRFNVFSSPAAATSFIAEGTATAGEITTLTTSPTNVTIREYGQFLKMTRLQDMAAVKGTRDEVADRMAYAAALTIDGLVRTRAKGGTALLANGASTLAATDTLSARDLITASLETLSGDNDVVGLRGVQGHPDGEFAAVVHPEAEADMVSEAATSTNKVVWSEIVKHVPGTEGQQKAIKGSMGSVYGTACYRSQNVDTSVLTNTITAFNNFVIGDGALGCVALEDMDPVIYVNTPSSGDVGNPYRNFSTIAWHVFYGDALIDANRVVRLYSAK